MQPARCSASLTALPPELLAYIASQLDHPSALNLALTSPVLTGSAEHGLWRRLDLSLNPYLPRGPSDASEVAMYIRAGLWDEPEVREVLERHRYGIRRRWERFESSADAQRLSHVRSLSLVPHLGLVPEMAKLLGEVSRNLLELEIQTSGYRRQRWNGNIIPHRYTLDFLLVRQGLSFPSLTHLSLGIASIRFTAVVPLFVDAAPNLTSLEISIMDTVDLPVDLGVTTPSISRDTKLQRALVRYSDGGVGSSASSFPVLKALLEHSPELRELYMGYGWPVSAGAGHLVSVIGRLAKLESLYWRGPTEIFTMLPRLDTQIFSKLKRLVLENRDWIDPFSVVPTLPNLEVVHLDCWARQSTNSSQIYSFHNSSSDLSQTRPPTPSPAQVIPPDLVDLLHDNPRLHTLNLFRMGGYGTSLEDIPAVIATESAGHVTSRVRSYKHGNSELLQLRMLLQDVRAKDWTPLADPAQQVWRRIPYTRSEQEARSQAEEDHGGFLDTIRVPKSQDMTEYEGKEVPVELLERMRVVQGASKEEWMKRGVEVGDEAWRILEDYLNGV